MIELLEEWDRQLFLWLNSLHAPWLDTPMMLMTKGGFWLPVYVALCYLVWKAFNLRILLYTLLGVALVVTLCDRTSVLLFKEVFMRYRPSHNFDLAGMVHHVNDYKGGKFGFVSSHAANFFGISTFLFFVIRKEFPRIAPWIFAWAALICYTRIYLGVHYPGDILAGALLGGFIGWVVYRPFSDLVLNPFVKNENP